MILVDAILADEKPTGIGVYTFNLVKNLIKYLDFEVLTHNPDLFPGLRTVRAPSFVSPSRGKNGAILRTFYLQTLTGKGILYRPYHHISLFWRGKQIITVHDLLPILFPERYREQYYFFKYFLKRFINFVDFVITVSHRSKEDIVEFFKIEEGRVRVFYQGYNEEVFKPVEDKDRILKIKGRFGLFDYILVVGAQYSHKNVEVVMKAIKYLEPLQLVITGTREPYESILLKTATELGLSDRVKILKYVPQEDLVYLYAGAIALAFPSKYEGFGIPVLEAMAVGTPVIGTYAVKEAGGDAIIYADPDDFESWVSAINKVLKGREDLVRKGFERVKNFSWDKTAREISSFLSSLL
jgi:glycosyltransferase involved in cell wall biosynthesis